MQRRGALLFAAVPRLRALEFSTLDPAVAMQIHFEACGTARYKDGLSINSATDDGHADALVLQRGKIFCRLADPDTAPLHLGWVIQRFLNVFLTMGASRWL